MPSSITLGRQRMSATFYVMALCFVVWAASSLFAEMRAPKPGGQVVPITIAMLSPVTAVADDAQTWLRLSEAQRKTLRPLQALWPTLDDAGRQRWLGVAGQLQRFGPGETARVQTRMLEWAKLSTKERAEARLQYLIAKRVPAEKRKEQWAKYQSARTSPASRKMPGTQLSMVGPVTAHAAAGASTMMLSQLPTATTTN